MKNYELITEKMAYIDLTHLVRIINNGQIPY